MISLFTFAILGKDFAKSGIRKIIENEPVSLLFTVIKTNNKVHCDYVIRRTEDYTHFLNKKLNPQLEVLSNGT
jgi:hypothetical protein